MASSIREKAEVAALLISDAGGKVVGRTRLQKIAYLLEAMGYGSGLEFEYRHYGPYSENLSKSVKFAEIFDIISEEVYSANWGGTYSIFKSDFQPEHKSSENRLSVIALGNQSDPVELELAATAIYLAQEGYENPWGETENRKPEKASAERIERAKVLLDKFRAIDLKEMLPEF